MNKKIILAMMPYWSTLIPPMGIGSLKRYLEGSGYRVKTVDANVEPRFQEIEDRYFGHLKEMIPLKNQGNLFNIGTQVLSRHMMARFHYNHYTDENAYMQLVKQLVSKTFFTDLTNDRIAVLNQLMDQFYSLLDNYVRELLHREKPTVLGLSTYNVTLPASLYAFKLAKETDPCIKTVMGGGIFAGDLDIHSPNFANFLERTPYIDKIIVGEGEQLFLKYLNGELPETQRVYTLKDLGNQVLDLSLAPIPDFSDLDTRYYTMMASYTSRSCPFNCSFCSEKVLWGSYRKKKTDQIVKELISLYEKHRTQLFLMSDSLLNPVVNELSRAIIDRGLSLYWDGYLRVDDHACDPDITFQWRQGGFYRARLGLESGSPRILEAMGKKITPQQMKKAVTALARAGIKTTTYWVIGHPGETEADFQQTLDLIEEIKDELYEADCNPFYYHLTGQVQSDTWAEENRARRLYAPETDQMLMLQTWILDVPPSREETYRRLNRFVEHCKKLGIPNPYSLRDIHSADERWKRLHKEAVPSLLEFLGVKNNNSLPIDENKRVKKTVESRLQTIRSIAAGQNTKERDYWLSRLSGELVKTAFPYDAVNDSMNGNSDSPGIFSFQLSDAVSASLVKISNKSDIRLHILLTAGWLILLNRYTGNTDIIVGVPTYKQDVEGELINTVLALRNSVTGPMTVKELLLQVGQTVLEANQNQNYPIETLIHQLNLPGSAEEFPLFDLSILLESIHDRRYLDCIRQNMIVSFRKIGESIEGTIEYNSQFYRESTIRRLISHYSEALHRALSDVNHPISQVEILSEGEKKQILADFNNNWVDFPQDKFIYQYVEDDARRTPGHMAIKEADETSRHLTYIELNDQSDQLAQRLHECGIQPGDIIGVMMDRSIEMAVAMLGIWKAGGAYLPIDPDYPQDRIDYMLKDSGAKLVLATEDTEVTEGKGINEKLLVIKKALIVENESVKEKTLVAGRADDSEKADNNLAAETTKLRVKIELIELPELIDTHNHPPSFSVSSVTSVAKNAYVIYTSGTTGKPKGAMVEHIGMMNHIHSKINTLHITDQSIIAQNASHTFDISIWQFLAALACGGMTLIFPDSLILDPAKLMDRVREDRVTILEVVPSYLSVMLDAVKPRQDLPLTYLLVTGEEIKPSLVARWFDMFPGIKMVNAYGPTEASDDITHFVMDRAPDVARIPLGKPVQNFVISIVDEHMNICPVGVNGELCVWGIGVGRGYLNRPELTAERFCFPGALFEKNAPGPRKNFLLDKMLNNKNILNNKSFWTHLFSKRWAAGGSIYKTGDLCRWLEDGNIEFLGRIDHQVKILGYRIELGEIENRLTRVAGIKEAVVMDREDREGKKYLCAYVTGKEGKIGIPGTVELKKQLSGVLPDYMIPSYFVPMDTLPLTANGKIDRKALPEPTTTAAARDIPYITDEMLTRLQLEMKTNSSAEKAENLPEKLHESRITDEERRRILYEFNDTTAAFPAEKTLHQLFEEQVSRTPDHIALAGADSRFNLTYRQLNEKSNRLAFYLGTKGVQPGDIVGVMTTPSIEMIIGIFAVLKAGCAYLALSVTYPDKRIDFICKDSDMRAVLTDRTRELPGTGSNPIAIDLTDAGCYLGEGENRNKNRQVEMISSAAAVFYTSGSTGKPKGVVLDHVGLVNRLSWMQRSYPMDEHDVILQKTSVIFDVSMWEIFGWMFSGASLYFLPPGQGDNPQDIVDSVKAGRVTMIHFIPTPLASFLNRIETTDQAKDVATLKHVFASGEVLTPSLVEKFNRLLFTANGTRLHNLYGPTEASIEVSFFDCPTHEPVEIVPIGKPIANVGLHIVDRYFQPVPIGVVGQLCISGIALARGYLNQPELTSERFCLRRPGALFEKTAPGPCKNFLSDNLSDIISINRLKNKSFWPHLFSKRWVTKRAPLYTTGDLARWLDDGNIEFLGRMDQQVKINGIRIEVGEVESALLKHHDISDAVVIPRTDEKGELYLCAFLVAEHDLGQSDFRETLVRELPHYMIPARFVRLEKLPLTPSGKVDRKVLALIELEAGQEIEYMAPRTDIETQVAEIWKDILNKDKVGINDNFFDLGGNSLGIIQVNLKLKDVFKQDIPALVMFEHSTVSALAQYLEKTMSTTSTTSATSSAQASGQPEVIGEDERMEVKNRGKNKMQERRNKVRESRTAPGNKE
ncbi:MAG: amino acid adenylation domain-containing protein [Candidatus Omnitrophota bacterium]